VHREGQGGLGKGAVAAVLTGGLSWRLHGRNEWHFVEDSLCLRKFSRDHRFDRDKGRVVNFNN
jgi:hypothetical protein